MCRQPQRSLHFRDRVEAVDEPLIGLLTPLRVSKNVGSQNEIGETARLVRYLDAGPGMVAILGNEPPSITVDQYALYQLFGRIDWRSQQKAVHMLGGAPGRHAELDCRAVVVRAAHDVGLAKTRNVLRQHLRVLAEASGGKNDAARCAVEALFSELASAYAHDPIPGADQGIDLDVENSLNAAGLGMRRESVECQRAAAFHTVECDLVAAGCGPCSIAEWPHPLVTRPDKTLAAGLDDRLESVIAAIE